MSSKKAATKKPISLAEAKKIAVEIANRFDFLVDSLSEPDRKSIEEIDLWDLQGENTMGDVLDKLNSIRYGLISRTDSRPQPLDYSNDVWDISSHEQVDPRIKEELLRERRRWREWARCDSPGYRDKAIIGGKAFDMKELKHLKSWIASVIDWHDKHPDKAKE